MGAACCIRVQIIQRKTHAGQQLDNGKNQEELRPCPIAPALPESNGDNQYQREHGEKRKYQPEIRNQRKRRTVMAYQCRGYGNQCRAHNIQQNNTYQSFNDFSVMNREINTPNKAKTAVAHWVECW